MARTSVLTLVALLCALAQSRAAEEKKSIALVIDASGSMNAALPSGETRIDAAKKAVDAFVQEIDPDVRISYRAYGHQSPRTAHDCTDTELLVDFSAAKANRDAIRSATKTVKAQGYTPITYVIGLAAADVAKEEGARTIVLVSDGKETCEGDPCATARALADADAKLVIHTIGFNVDAAARLQLKCMANVTSDS